MRMRFELIVEFADRQSIVAETAERSDIELLAKAWRERLGAAAHHGTVQPRWRWTPTRVVCCNCSDEYKFQNAQIEKHDRVLIDTCPSCNEDWFMSERKIGDTDLYFVQNVRWSLPCDPKYFLMAR